MSAPVNIPSSMHQALEECRAEAHALRYEGLCPLCAGRVERRIAAHNRPSQGPVMGVWFTYLCRACPCIAELHHPDE